MTQEKRTETKSAGYLQVLKQKEYMKLTVALVINRFGDAVDAIASTWIVYMLTSSAAWSAIIFGINMLPTVFITPFAGAFVEGRNKKSVMIATDLIRGVCVAYVATAFWLGTLEAWHLIITSLVISTAEAFRTPASLAITPMILETDLYEYGMSLSNSLKTVVELIGCGVAAGVIALVGISGAIYLDMATFFLSAGIIACMHIKEVLKKGEGFRAKEYMQTLKEGFSYAVKRRILVYLCIVGLFMNALLVPLNSLQAPMIKELLGQDEIALSVFGIVLSVSMLAGSVLYPAIRKRLSGRAIISLCGGILALFYLGIVLCKPLYASTEVCYLIFSTLTFLLGFAAAVASSFASVELVKQVEEGYLARVGAIFTAISVAVNPVFSFAIGGIAKVINTQTIFLAVGVVALVETIILAIDKTLSEV